MFLAYIAQAEEGHLSTKAFWWALALILACALALYFGGKSD